MDNGARNYVKAISRVRVPAEKKNHLNFLLFSFSTTQNDFSSSTVFQIFVIFFFCTFNSSRYRSTNTFRIQCVFILLPAATHTHRHLGSWMARRLRSPSKQCVWKCVIVKQQKRRSLVLGWKQEGKNMCRENEWCVCGWSSCVRIEHTKRVRERKCKIIDPVRPWWWLWCGNTNIHSKGSEIQNGDPVFRRPVFSPSNFLPIETLISTNKNALKSTTDGRSTLCRYFQQLIDYRNARKTQLRFCLLWILCEASERAIFFPSKWSVHVVSCGKHTAESWVGLPQLTDDGLTYTMFEFLSLLLSLRALFLCVAPYDALSQPCLLLVNRDNLSSETEEKTGNYIAIQAHCSVHTWPWLVEREEKTPQQKVFIEHTERRQKIILKKMFLVGRSRSNFNTYGGKMQNFLVALCGKIVKSAWKCVQSVHLSGIVRKKSVKIGEEMWFGSRGLHILWPRLMSAIRHSEAFPKFKFV